MTDPNQIMFDAVGFAARAHRHQLRKDRDTPYVSHVFRVCLVVRHVFGFDDPRMLAAAVLHDTIEDTTTDYDDLIEHFGPDVARWVAALTKDMRLPHDEREEVYRRTLAAADWQVGRVARATGLGRERVQALVDRRAESPLFGWLGEPRVNVLLLNLDVDDAARALQWPP